MNVGKESFIVKTLAGDYVAVRSSLQFAEADARKCTKETGLDCVIFRVAVLEVIKP